MGRGDCENGVVVISEGEGECEGTFAKGESEGYNEGLIIPEDQGVTCISLKPYAVIHVNCCGFRLT